MSLGPPNYESDKFDTGKPRSLWNLRKIIRLAGFDWHFPYWTLDYAGKPFNSTRISKSFSICNQLKSLFMNPAAKVRLARRDTGQPEGWAKMSFDPRVYGKLSDWAVLVLDQHHIRGCSSWYGWKTAKATAIHPTLFYYSPLAWSKTTCFRANYQRSCLGTENPWPLKMILAELSMSCGGIYVFQASKWEIP